MTDAERIPRVLVVDDEPNIRELVQVALKFHGCAVSTAANGTDAMRQADTVKPDLIVLDVMLPDIDGFEVCRRLRAAGNEVPVIFLTARDTSSDTRHRARDRRRRLRHQAVLRRGAGRPGPGGAAAGRQVGAAAGGRHRRRDAAGR